jgi:atypical dual specificity phosphatase
MMSFPAQNWQNALRATKASLNPSRNAAFGRLASQITPRLYLSDYWSARDTAKLESLGITHIISVLEFTPDLPEIIPQDQRLHVALADIPEAKILDHLDATTAFILKALAENDGNKILVSPVFRFSLATLKRYALD